MTTPVDTDPDDAADVADSASMPALDLPETNPATIPADVGDAQVAR